VDRDSIDRIRSATFPVGRRGYEKREVDRFLAKLADWLETGGADQSRAEIVRRDLERVGQQTEKILTEAHGAGEQIRAEAEREAVRVTDEANAEASETQATADRYASETRTAAEADARKIRADADEYASEARADADVYATRIVSEGNRRRTDIEAVISDLEARRDTVVADMQRLSSELAGTATQHRAVPASADPELARAPKNEVQPG